MTNTRHPEYEKLIAIAEGKQMQLRSMGNSWHDTSTCEALSFINLGTGGQVRIKPRTMTINGIEFPEPMREAPEVGTPYWVVDLSADVDDAAPFEWDGDNSDLRWLKAGLCQATEQGAIDCAKALLSLLEEQS